MVAATALTDLPILMTRKYRDCPQSNEGGPQSQQNGETVRLAEVEAPNCSSG